MSVSLDRRRTSPRRIPDLSNWSKILLVTVGLSLVTVFVSVLGLGLDGRLITGAPAWLKPLKFAVSIAVYCATLAWLLSLVDRHRRLVGVVAWTTGLALLLELVLIITQVLRGTTSHFNVADGFDLAVFNAMGGLVSLVFLVAFVAALLVARQRGLSPVLASGIRGGLVVSLLGMASAVLMILNTGIDPGGAHTVGAADGGPGLPMTGWSTEHGDLRVAHFVGLHALQFLPLVAWLFARYATGLSERVQVRLVRLASVGCTGLVVLLAVQAERGLPLLRPDGVIIAAGAIGLVVVGLAAAFAVARGVRA